MQLCSTVEKQHWQTTMHKSKFRQDVPHNWERSHHRVTCPSLRTPYETEETETWEMTGSVPLGPESARLAGAEVQS